MSISFPEATQEATQGLTLSQSSAASKREQDATGLDNIQFVEFLYGEKVSSPSTWTNLKNRVSLIANAIGTNLAKIIKSVINAILAPVYCLKRFFFECKSSDISSAKH